MSGKVVNNGEMVFWDDIIIIEEELSKPLRLSGEIPIFSRDQLQIFYNGKIYVPKKSDDVPSDGKDIIKIYATTYLLKKIESPKKQEDAWVKKHAGLFDIIKKEFIERSVDGISISVGDKSVLGHQISAELIEKLNQDFADGVSAGSKTPIAEDGSCFNTLEISQKSLVLDKKLYGLITPLEYFSRFETDFLSEFYAELQDVAGTKKPEELAKILEDNKESMNPKAFDFIKDKLWNGKRSFEIRINGQYLIPNYQSRTYDVIRDYTCRLEQKIKQSAATDFK